MDALMRIGLTNAALAGLLAVPALLASWLLPKRPAVAHALWLLVLLKLLTPPLIGLPVWSAPAAPPEPEPPAFECGKGLPAVEPAEPAADAPEPPPETPAPWPVGGMLVVIWLGGSAAYLLIAVIRLRRLNALLSELPDAGIDIAPLAARLGLRRVPRVLLAPGRVPPMLAAAWPPPWIVLPRELWATLDPAQHEALLLHELAHLARGDHWVRRLELLVLALYWWCPVAWLACREIRRAEEECCDAWVTWASPESGPAYAGALVETAAFLSGGPRVPIGACGAAPILTLKRRLAMILLGSTPRGLSWAGLALVAALALGLPLVPVAADPPKPAERPAPDINAVIAANKSCVACHQASAAHDAEALARWLGRALADDPKAKPAQMLALRYRHLGEKAKELPADLHALIVKLLQELEKQKADMAATERRLKDALAAFEKKAAEKKATPKATPPRDRMESLERQLNKIEEELKALRESLQPKLPPKAKDKEKTAAEADALRKLEAARKALRDQQAAIEAARALRDKAEKEKADREHLDRAKQRLLELLKEREKAKPKRPPAEGSNGSMHINLRTFALPVRWDDKAPEARTAMAYVTSDGGRSWRHIHSMGRGDGSPGHFSHTAPADGRYGFFLRTGRETAPSTGTRPNVEVVVDTVPPTVAFTAKQKGRVASLYWDAVDDHLDLSRLVVEYRADGGWKPYPLSEAQRMSKGTLDVEVPGVAPAAWRVRVYDRAGNVTVREAEVA